MPKKASLDQRIAWHVAHAKACGCREITGKLRTDMLAHGIDVDALTASQRKLRAG
jgi:hypothetical protein